MATIIPLSAVEPALVEQLLDEAFGEDRMARTAYRVREGSPWLEALSFAALDDGDFLAGSIQLWPVALATPDVKGHPLIMVGPVAVLPALQGEGYGKALMGAALGAVEAMAADGTSALPQVMIGDAEYYGQWGFSADHTGNWHCPGPYDPARLLLRCDNPGILPDEGMLGPWAG
ncbi:GNAT family N-acetyltransferase [Erythrobacter litoralis]|uniref:Putative acetyltransferase n=1 Tax=Erythrobacter litoralis (strain HTCC2594) TaxID=314225 RepID=Q2NCP7_ERYLH|nr:N-acetyltransferase [Erythrobacter litoralis]ABC62544.1 putative acetyltransferase [Erythrobacter litoralis HTCC2594]